jgi:hypothetical protein
MKHIGQAWFSVASASELMKASAENTTSSGLDAAQLRQDSSQIVKALIENEANVQVSRLTNDPGLRLNAGTDFFSSGAWPGYPGFPVPGKKNKVDRIVSRATVVKLYIAMSRTDTESPALRDSFLCTIVHKCWV